jgi:hypothetical protein
MESKLSISKSAWTDMLASAARQSLLFCAKAMATSLVVKLVGDGRYLSTKLMVELCEKLLVQWSLPVVMIPSVQQPRICHGLNRVANFVSDKRVPKDTVSLESPERCKLKNDSRLLLKNDSRLFSERGLLSVFWEVMVMDSSECSEVQILTLDIRYRAFKW